MNASSVEPFSTCDFCDAHKGDETDSFRWLSPSFQNFGGTTVFSGAVSTVQCHEDNTPVKAAVESAGHGRVLVVDGGGSLRRALVGGNLAASAACNGWAGLVVYGCVRDVAELRTCLLGIRALALVPMPTQRRRDGLRDVALQIAGAWVRPGDWLYADADGIVVSSSPLQGEGLV